MSGSRAQAREIEALVSRRLNRPAEPGPVTPPHRGRAQDSPISSAVRIFSISTASRRSTLARTFALTCDTKASPSASGGAPQGDPVARSEEKSPLLVTRRSNRRWQRSPRRSSYPRIPNRDCRRELFATQASASACIRTMARCGDARRNADTAVPRRTGTRKYQLYAPI